MPKAWIAPDKPVPCPLVVTEILDMHQAIIIKWLNKELCE